ncbi:MAG: hypothetical protein ACI9JM_003069 [Halioglobus sp.]|jgi:hypothetical protein
MMVMKSWLIVIFVMLSEIAVTAHATEEPAWTLLDTQGDIELRHYAPVVQARTPTPDGVTSSGGFRTLAGYIFGGNASKQEIAMTAPVERTLAENDNYMAFTMPEQHSRDSLPEPDDRSVTLHQVPARTVAVIKFSGWARDQVVQEKVQDLLATLAAHGIEPQSQPLLAQYNPPWTPPWKRRNEVMVAIPEQTGSFQQP